MSPFLSEFLGTMLLVLLGDGVVGGVVLKGTKAENGGWLLINLAWGLAVALSVYAVGQYSGAHINPAVTLGFASVGLFPWEQVSTYLTAQMLGGLTGGVLVWLHYLPHWGITPDPADKLAVFCTAPARRSFWANLFSETLGTFVLVCGLLFIGANQFTEGLNPLVVGLLIVAIGMSLGGTTGYAINPARDLAPRIAHFLLPIKGKGGSDWSYAPVPVLGPVLGGVYGALFFKTVFEGGTAAGFWPCTAIVAVVALLAVWKEYTS